MKSRIIATAKTPFRPFKHGAVAVSRQIMLDLLFSEDKAPHNLIISTRGAGTTFLMKHLAQFIHTNDPFEGDRIKHLPRLPGGWLKSRRILYVYSEPELVFLSIKRRSWVHMHAGELGCLTCQFTWGRLRQMLFERAVRKQINQFHAYQSDNIMLLAYDDIWDKVEEISTFFKINDERFVCEFPARRPRKSPLN